MQFCHGSSDKECCGIFGIHHRSRCLTKEQAKCIIGGLKGRSAANLFLFLSESFQILSCEHARLMNVTLDTDLPDSLLNEAYPCQQICLFQSMMSPRIVELLNTYNMNETDFLRDLRNLQKNWCDEHVRKVFIRDIFMANEKDCVLHFVSKCLHITYEECCQLVSLHCRKRRRYL